MIIRVEGGIHDNRTSSHYQKYNQWNTHKPKAYPNLGVRDKKMFKIASKVAML